MSVPSFEELLLPLLRLAHNPEGASTDQAATQVAQDFALDEQELAARMRGTSVPLLVNRIAWGWVYLQRAGLVRKLERGRYIATDRGSELLARNPKSLTLNNLRSLWESRGKESSPENDQQAIGFSWVPFYEELADRLRPFRHRQEELLELMAEVKRKGLPMVDLRDHTADGTEPLPGMDPFTVFAAFNRHLKHRDRIRAAAAIGEQLGVQAPPPADFLGIPVVQSVSARFFAQRDMRQEGDFDALWELFEQALDERVQPSAFQAALKVYSVGLPTLTIGLFWIRPRLYFPLDGNSRDYLRDLGVIDLAERDLRERFLQAGDQAWPNYLAVVQRIRERLGDDFPRLSHEAYLARERRKEREREARRRQAATSEPEQARAAEPGEAYAAEPIPRNLVLYGPPGTGKTWRLHHEIAPRLLLGERAGTLDEAARARLDERMHSVTFHQAFGYEDFVEGIRPVSEQGGVRYELQPGLFRQVCELALRAAGVTEGMDAFGALERNERAARLRDAPPVLLAIDELNRGNVAAILGELVTLLEEDKRLGAEHEVIVTLPGSRERFGVPPNLWVVATMNTADRSIVALDAALRRRFAFEEVPPRPELLAGLVVEGVEVERLLRAINRRIERLLDRDHRLGHAAFLRLRGEPTLAALRSLFASYVLPQLQEHFHEDLGRVGLVLGPRFVRQEREPEPFAAGFEHELREELGERPLWRLVDPRGLGPEDFRSVYEPVEAG